ncbi:MAG: MlaD family protein [Solirubrobacteraceae bacterium]|nr:MlaD family protein [Solirubrobacteraceae bacterium]
MTHGITRGRLALETRRSVRSIPILLLAVAATVAGGIAIFSQLSNTLLKSTVQARFAVDDAFGVLAGVDDVRYRGVPAGTIMKIEREGTQPVLRIKIREDYPLYRDARAELRPETPLNDQYLDIIDPGTPKAGRLDEDHVVPASRTAVNVKVNDVLNTLEANERTRLTQLLDNLGNGMEDGGRSLRAAVNQFTPFVASAHTLTKELAKRDKAVKRLIHNAGVLTKTLGDREQQLRTLVREGSATLGTLQEGSADLDRTLAELPQTTRAVDSGLRSVVAVLGDVDRAVADLRPIARRLPGDLSTVRKLDAALSPAVRRLMDPVDRLVPFARALRPLADDASDTVDALSPQTPWLDKATRSLALCEKAVQGFFQWNASLSKFGDVRAPIPRGNLAVNAPDLGIPGVAKRKPAENCAGGVTIDGRVPTKEDES